MDDLLSEKEQIDQIRSWWSEYGAYVIGGVVIGVGMLFAVNHYRSAKLQSQLDASTAYESLVVHVADGKLEDAEQAAEEIASTFQDTTYAGQAGLAMARLYMDKNRDQDAADALKDVLGSDTDDELKHVARLRLARILLYQGKADEVVGLLEEQDNASFAAAYGEVLGDAYATLGQVADAQTAYQQVLLDPLVRGTVDQQLVQWKALDLPEVIVAEEAVDPETATDTTAPAEATNENENAMADEDAE